MRGCLDRLHVPAAIMKQQEQRRQGDPGAAEQKGSLSIEGC
jgi:hypothetical protein